MGNMGYCRFHNTVEDLDECYQAMDDELSPAEMRSRWFLVKLCRQIVDDYEHILDEKPPKA